MGLDYVELFMRAEEEFGITIEDSEAEQCDTPGKLCALIERKVGVIQANTLSFCPTSRAFYRVRRELMGLGIERAQVRPAAKLEALLPRSKRRENWQMLSETLQLPMPQLERSPEWAFVGLLPLGVFPILLLVAPLQGFILGIGYGFAWWLGVHATKLMAVHPPDGSRTVADLARQVAWTHADPIREGAVWPQLQLIIADELSIPPEKVTRDADFFLDLGMG